MSDTANRRVARLAAHLSNAPDAPLARVACAAVRLLARALSFLPPGADNNAATPEASVFNPPRSVRVSTTRPAREPAPAAPSPILTRAPLIFPFPSSSSVSPPTTSSL